MRIAGLIAGGLIAATVVAGAFEASAQTRRAPQSNTLSLSPSGGEGQRRGLQLNENGRWGLNLNLSQPVGREADWSDVQAGAYYRVNPRLRVGAAAVLDAPERDPARPSETDRRAQPRVRLESIFRF